MRKIVHLALALSVALATMVIVPMSFGNDTAFAGPHQKGCHKYNSDTSRKGNNC